MSSEGDSFSVEQLLAAQAEGSGSAASGVAEMLAGHPDPNVRLLAQLWAQRQQVEEAEDDDGQGSELLEIPQVEPPPTPANRRLRARFRELKEELHYQMRVNDTLAAALGACPHCWGEELDCETCRGAGGPGWELPDRSLFRTLVLPALERLKRSARTAVPRPSHLREVPRIEDRDNDPERSSE